LHRYVVFIRLFGPDSETSGSIGKAQPGHVTTGNVMVGGIGRTPHPLEG
jgi:hypothetical protein